MVDEKNKIVNRVKCLMWFGMIKYLNKLQVGNRKKKKEVNGEYDIELKLKKY